jgi:hypothetical protein
MVSTAGIRKILGSIAICASFSLLALPPDVGKYVGVIMGSALALDQFVGNGSINLAQASNATRST